MEFGTEWVLRVKSLYKKLFKHEENGSLYPFIQTWKISVPPRVLFFAWEATRECCLTIDNLRKRGKELVKACYLCKWEEETSNQLFFWCPVVYKLWIIVYGLLGIN